MEVYSLKIEKKNLPVYLLFFIMSFCKGINLTKDSFIYLLIFAASVVLLIFKIYDEKYTRKEIYMTGLFLTLGALIYFMGKNTTPLFFAITISCLKNVDLKKVIKIIFFTKLVSFALMIFLTSTGIIENKVLIHVREEVGLTKRYYFGYSHPNLAQMHLLTLTLMYYYLYGKKHNFIVDIIALSLNYILYLYTYSRTSLYMCIIFLVVNYFTHRSEKSKKNFALIGKYSFFIMFIITIVLTLTYKTNITQRVDTILTGRIYYWDALWKNFSIPLIGTLKYKTNVELIIDNSYLALLYQSGILFTVLISIMNWKLGNTLYKEKKYELLVMLLFINIFCLTEDFYMIPVINFVALYYQRVLFNSKTIRIE